MKFLLSWASSGRHGPERDSEAIELESLDDLRELQEREGDELVINFDVKDGPPQITVYDDYME